jgi:nucleotide-binding universal stress UspA family protein
MSSATSSPAPSGVELATTTQPIPTTRSKQPQVTSPRSFIPIRRVLCPVDFSDFSRAAVEQAVAIAKPFHAEITAVFVLPFVPTEGDVASCAAPVAPDPGIQSAVAEDLEEFLRPARDAGLDVRLCVRSGECVGHVLDEAALRESDLIVMGTHGRSGFERWVLGSVTGTVLRNAPCPVLAVPGSVARSTPQVPVSGRILCAVDLSEQSGRTLSYALALGRSTGSSVSVLHVWDGAGGPRTRAIWEAEVSQRLHAAALADGPPACPVTEVVLSGTPHREILRLAEAKQAGVIVREAAIRASARLRAGCCVKRRRPSSSSDRRQDTGRHEVPQRESREPPAARASISPCCARRRRDDRAVGRRRHPRLAPVRRRLRRLFPDATAAAARVSDPVATGGSLPALIAAGAAGARFHGMAAG